MVATEKFNRVSFWAGTGKRYYMKKGFVTRVKALILALTIFSCSFVCNPKEVKAATNLNLNQVYNFSVTYGSPQTFTFQTPATGYIRVEVTVTDVKDGQGKTAYGNLIDCQASVDNKSILYTLIGRNSGTKASTNYAFAPGKTGTINVSADVSVPWTYYYQIKIVNETPENFEAEDNNTADTANKIKTKKVYNGILNEKNEDADWYVFKAPKTGNYRFFFQNMDDARTGDFFYVQGYKKKNKVDSRIPYTSVHAGKGWCKSKKIRLKKGKKYYIRISDSLYDSNAYQIKVKKVK
jgi:hypothetical protein